MSEFTIVEAQDYARRIEHYKDYYNIEYIDLYKSLEILAIEQDEKNFRKIVDSFVRLTKSNKSGIHNGLHNNPLNFLEFLCIGIDHSFSSIGHVQKGEKLPVKETQAYFNKFYGEHFY